MTRELIAAIRAQGFEDALTAHVTLEGFEDSLTALKELGVFEGSVKMTVDIKGAKTGLQVFGRPQERLTAIPVHPA
jgi:hypothetical protein